MPLSRSVASWCLVCALAVAAGSAVHAQQAPSPADGPAWSSLTPAQQAALRPLRGEWPGIDPTRKGKWLEVADRLPSMPPAERARIQERMTAWAAMTPAQRGQARMNYREAQRLSAEDRKARWAAYQSLSPDQQRALAERAAPASATGARRARADDRNAKSSLVPRSALDARPAPVAPSLAQARPGATTNLVTRRAAPPAHQQPGLPKIPTGSAFVDSRTLLPKRGAQAPATRTPAAASAPLLERP